jgi:hypothetical protein
VRDVRALTLLFDAADLAPYTRRWLEIAPKYVPLRLVHSHSGEAARWASRFPPESLTEHLTLVDDEGNVWRDAKAELMVLWALRRYRGRALRIGHPSRLPFRRSNLNWVAGGEGVPWPDGSAHGGAARG